MWDKLIDDKKNKYKTYIINFASLSEAFSQKDSHEDNVFVAPIVNSKFQETVFQKAFGAVGEDIANTSFDCSLIVDKKHKYLVGIKSFGIASGDQKIAQFKNSSTSENWEEILSEIKRVSDSVKSKDEADNLNHDRYLFLANRISELRNERIQSSREQIKGFNGLEEDVYSVYHVLMPSKKGEDPTIYVGETEYSTIDIENITILGSTSKNKPTNFKFTDGIKQYKYTSADSQLYMSFDNKNISIDEWKVSYVQDPFSLFENLHNQLEKDKEDQPIPVKTVSWMIADENGVVHKNSGFNAFNGNTKYGKEERKTRLKNILSNFEEDLKLEDQQFLRQALEKILLTSWNSEELKEERDKLRRHVMMWIQTLSHNTEKSIIEKLEKDVGNLIYRPIQEVYIPIPDSRKFHDNNKDFFGENIGIFQPNSSKLKLNKKERTFKLVFLQSEDEIEAYINQDSGKSIQSTKKQDILGKWLIEGVFQLEPRELLTKEKLDNLEINAIRLSKYKEPKEYIGLEFIWIDETNPPEDAIGWVAKEGNKEFSDR